jgi:tRNA pseudouridine55 synthase
VRGRRAYQLAREGRAPVLDARAVTVHEFTISDPRPAGADGCLLDVTAVVRCSSGTYVRALARDLGESLGVGGHLTMLRRTRVGPYRLSDARTMDELAADLRVMPLAQAAAAAFPVRSLTEAETRGLSHGASLNAAGSAGPVAALAPDGTLVALVEERDGQARPLAVFVP